MNHETYIKVLCALGEDLQRAANARPYDPDAYNKVIDAINSTNRAWYRSQHREPWFFRVLVWILAVILCVLILRILR